MRTGLERQRATYLAAAVPELEQAQNARAEAKIERDKLYHRFRETEDRSWINYINDRMNFLTREIDRLDARIDMLKSETKSFSNYDLVDQEIDRIKALFGLYAEIDQIRDREELRRVLLANLDHIQCEEKGNFRMVPSESSPKCTEWWR